jgi:hypothetical protein
MTHEPPELMFLVGLLAVNTMFQRWAYRKHSVAGAFVGAAVAATAVSNTAFVCTNLAV